MTDSTPAVSELLPLPTCWTYEHPVRLYTDAQMRAYAAENVESLRAALADAKRDAERWRTYERELPISASTTVGFVDSVIARDTAMSGGKG